MKEENTFFALLPYVFSVLVLLALLFFPKAFFIALPFVLSFLSARMLQGAIYIFEKRLGIRREISTLLVVVLFLSLFSAFIFFLSKLLLKDAVLVFPLVERGFNKIEALHFFENISFESEALHEWIIRALGSVISIIRGFFGFFPNLVISLSIMIFSTYYLALDYEKIKAFFNTPRLYSLKKSIEDTFSGYVKGYFLIFLLTFALVLTALVLLRVRSPLLLSFFISLFDLLPIFGAGAVFLPWGAVLIFTGEASLGARVLILYAFIFFIRQFAEPKILARLSGVHPLIPFIAGGTGVVFFGFSGLFLLPVFSVFLCNLYKNEKAKK